MLAGKDWECASRLGRLAQAHMMVVQLVDTHRSRLEPTNCQSTKKEWGSRHVGWEGLGVSQPAGGFSEGPLHPPEGTGGYGGTWEV